MNILCLQTPIEFYVRKKLKCKKMYNYIKRVAFIIKKMYNQDIRIWVRETNNNILNKIIGGENGCKELFMLMSLH